MNTLSGKILASVALVGTAAAVAGLGTYGSFASSTTANETVTAGTVKIALGNTASDTLSVPVSGVLPGDTVERLVTVANTGDSDFGSVSLTTTATGTPSALTTDTTNGLQLLVENCSVAWTGTAAPYTCTGTNAKTTVLASAPIIGANRTLGNLTSLASQKTDYLKVSAVLPAAAPDSFQGISSTVSFSFAATQRAATVK